MQLTLVKIGSDNRPATTEDVELVESQLATLFGDDGLADAEPVVLVTHHNVQIEQYYIDDREVIPAGMMGGQMGQTEGNFTHKRRAVKVVGCSGSAPGESSPGVPGYQDTGPCESEPM